MSNFTFSSFAMGDKIREYRGKTAFDFRHERKVNTNADMIRIEAEILKLQWQLERARAIVPQAEDAKSACETRRLTGEKIQLPDGAVVTIERHNGYVMSGWDSKRGWWAVDLRNDKATIVA